MTGQRRAETRAVAGGAVGSSLRYTRYHPLPQEVLVGSVQPSDPLRHASLSDGSSHMRAIGTSSSRRHGPFVKINCAAIASGLIESELFGHEKGAFTGAHRRKPGQFEHAHKGTICLDEIGELPLALQAKLLHVLQDFRFSRVGGNGSIEVDSRVIAATNRNLEEAMARGEFREDPYYRVNVVEIRVPPLARAERRDSGAGVVVPREVQCAVRTAEAALARDDDPSPATLVVGQRARARGYRSPPARAGVPRR